MQWMQLCGFILRFSFLLLFFPCMGFFCGGGFGNIQIPIQPFVDTPDVLLLLKVTPFLAPYVLYVPRNPTPRVDDLVFYYENCVDLKIDTNSRDFTKLSLDSPEFSFREPNKETFVHRKRLITYKLPRIISKKKTLI
jgi:hypothetical protein